MLVTITSIPEGADFAFCVDMKSPKLDMYMLKSIDLEETPKHYLTVYSSPYIYIGKELEVEPIKIKTSDGKETSMFGKYNSLSYQLVSPLMLDDFETSIYSTPKHGVCVIDKVEKLYRFKVYVDEMPNIEVDGEVEPLFEKLYEMLNDFYDLRIQYFEDKEKREYCELLFTENSYEELNEQYKVLLNSEGIKQLILYEGFATSFNNLKNYRFQNNVTPLDVGELFSYQIIKKNSKNGWIKLFK